MGEGVQAAERPRWSHRIAFIFASLGAAVGFGNVWRFPSLAWEYGGGAFFVPYLLALFIIGIPITILEIGLGQMHQTGDVGVFGSINPRIRGIGLSSVTNSFFLVCYYAPLVAWVVRAFFDSFRSDHDWSSASGSDAFAYFITNILEMSTTDTSQWASLLPSRLIGTNVGYLALVWAVNYLCLAWGLTWTGRITYFTMGLPIVLLFVFLIRAVTLPGAADGIRVYIGEWDMSVLSERPEAWSTAVSQIFFSIGVTFGIMTAFGSYNERDAPAFANSCIVALGNSLFSFIAGFAVFASLGFLAHEEKLDVNDVVVAGPALVFGAWPVVLAQLPGGVHWVRLLFFNFFLLGIDSAFAMVEAVLTVVKDTVLLKDKPYALVAGSICFTSFICGFLYCTDVGFLFLDVVDFYVNFIMLLVGFFECVAVGWVYGLEKQISNVGWKAVLSYWVSTFGSVILASGLWFGLEKNAIWAGFVGGIALYLVGMAATVFLVSKEAPDVPMKTKMHQLLFENVLDCRNEMVSVVGYIPVIWAYMIKHLIPHLLLILFINLASSKTSAGVPLFGNYGGYVTWPYQVIGIFVVALTCFVITVGLAAPKTYACFQVSGPGVTTAVGEKAASGKEIEVEKDVEKDVSPPAKEAEGVEA